MSETVTLKGQKLNLKGTLVIPGQMAPDCELVGADLKAVRLSGFKGKLLLILSVPSLDTSVCSMETKRFNEEIAKYKNELNAVCVSMDLPFAQSRWCGTEGVEHVVTLSDYKTHDFGEKFGVLIQEIGLLARAIFILDPQMKVIYSHLIKEVSQEPDYKEILDELRVALSRYV